MGTCENYDSNKLCIDDSDMNDPEWGFGDSYPDPVFEKGGDCSLDSSPSFYYKGHEACQGNVECEYPACIIDTDCGSDKWLNSKYCNSNNVYQVMRNFTCVEGNTYEASCLQEDEAILLEECGENQACNEGICIDIECGTKQDCGNDDYLGKYCTNNGIYNDYRTWTCENPGTALSECTYTDATEFTESCDLSLQVCVYGECISKENYILGTFDDGDEEKQIVFYQQSDETFYIKLPKNTEIRNTSLNVGGGLE